MGLTEWVGVVVASTVGVQAGGRRQVHEVRGVDCRSGAAPWAEREHAEQAGD